MTTPPRIFSSLLVLSSFFASANSTYSQITIDGTLDADYGSPLAVQLAPTGFGDNTDADVLSANGSELNAAYAVIRDGHLHLFLAGNLETNFNKLEIFIDSLDGVGQNILGATNPNVDFDGLNAMAGLTFDSDFAADYYLTASGGNSPDEEFFFNFAQVKAVGDGGTGNYIGQTAANVQTATLTGGIVTVGIDVGIDNSNAGGVTATDATTPSAEDAPNVTTGIEFKIPLTEIGAPTGSVKICAFINNNTHTFLSNQVLGSLPADYANLGAPGTVDFVDNSTTTNQFFTVPWQVTNTADNGAGSLRQTIADAPSGTTITFDPDLPGGTITLGGTQLVIDKDLTIDASALPDGLIIDANANSRIFRIDGTAARRTVTLRRLTLTGGDVEISDSPNRGGAIHANNADLTLDQCLVTANTAAHGGGIDMLGASDVDKSSLILRNTTIHANRAENQFPSGGGLFNTDCDVTLIQSTVTGNNGAYTDASGVVNPSRDNQVDTAGGIRMLRGELTLTNSVVAGNGPSYVSQNGNDILCRAGDDNTIVLNGTNFIGFYYDGSLTYPPDFPIPPGETFLTGDPELAPLGDYGGPTQTLTPLPGSPLIDAGTDTGDLPPTDQRGFTRVVDGTVDIGAVESQTSLTVINTNDSGSGSLREAITAVIAGATITFDPGLSGGTITLGGSQLLVDKDLTIDASALTAPVTINANDSSRVLYIAPGGHSVTLDSLVITGGQTPDNTSGDAESGGGIYNDGGTLTLTNTTVSGNTTGDGGGGGGIYSTGTLTLTNTTVSGNTTGEGDGGRGGGGGGGIYSTGTLTLTNTTVSGNTTGEGGGGFGGGGGGIYSTGTLTLTNTTVSGNTTGDGGGGGFGGVGGGIFNSGTLTLTNTTVSGNTTGDGDGIGGGGGGIASDGGSIAITNSTIANNTTGTGTGSFGGFGGGINGFNNVQITISSSTISGNITGNGVDDGGWSGGIEVTGTLTLTNSIIAGNTALGSINDLRISSGLTTNGFNIIGDNTGSNLSPVPGFVGTNASPVDPLLALLGDYGGPTQTMPPLPGSPAIEPAGGETTSAFTTDQRGASRIVGTVVDIGAVEAFPLPLATFTDSEPDGIPDLFEGPDGPYPQLTVGTDDSAVDTDGDGSTDAEELANMTNLYDANDYFRILSFAPAAGFDPANPSFDLSLPTFPGLSYHLESTADLTVDFEDIPDSSFTAEGFSEPITVDTSGDAQFIRAVRE